MNTTTTDTNIEYTAQRVAAAFGVGGWETIAWPFGLTVTKDFKGFSENGKRVVCRFKIEDSLESLYFIETVSSLFDLSGTSPALYNNNEEDELMARGLYCLGFEDESILSQLPALTAHEKLELRLAMPREFWPQKWLEEAEQSAL